MIVSLENFKTHLRIDSSDEDRLLEDKLLAAERYVERCLGFSFSTLGDTVPEPLKEAVRLYAGHLYSNREATIVGNSIETVPGFSEIISAYRDWSF